MKAQIKRRGKGQEGSLAARNALAIALYRAGCTGESLAELRRAIDLHPASPVPRISLAHILLHEGRPEEARAEAQGIFALGTRANAHQARGLDDAILLHRRIQVRLAARQQLAASRAIEDLRRSAEAFSGYPVPIVSEGLHEEASFRFTAAKHEINTLRSNPDRKQEVIQLMKHDSPNKSMDLVDLANLRLQVSDHPAAERLVRQALAADPHNLPAGVGYRLGPS